jgi:hypothetical protein
MIVGIGLKKHQQDEDEIETDELPELFLQKIRLMLKPLKNLKKSVDLISIKHFFFIVLKAENLNGLNDLHVGLHKLLKNH